MKPFAFSVALALWWSVFAGEAPAEDLRPNILWITAEDLSPNLGCYGDSYAKTPHLDRLARQSVRYTHAFATAPVCSPARSCLISGVYATSLGTQNLRSLFPFPDFIRGFPTYLRAAGYYCANNVKTDYNTSSEAAVIAACWDENSPQAHWRKRKKGQPFFCVFNLMTTHQSRSNVWSFEQFEKEVGRRLPPQQRHDPAKAPLPPYYPDTPLARKTMARFYDCITLMDKQVGDLLRQLDEDGLADNTLVFFFGDHGDGLPRGKRLLHDSGMKVPLLIRFPDDHRSLAPARPGEVIDRLVSFVDFAPTVLSLVGLEIPQYMQGQAFLGEAAAPARPFVFGARDRVDEAYEVSRSIRGPRYLYIRNYFPHLSWNQPEGYSDSAPMRREITALAKAGKLNPAQLTYAAPTKPAEELYDSQSDPHQIHNLAGSPKHQSVLQSLRKELRDWSLKTRDVGFLPESDVRLRAAGQSPMTMAANSNRYPLVRVLDAANLVGRKDALSSQIRLLKDEDSGVRFWAAVGLRARAVERGSLSEAAQAALRNAVHDRSAPVRIEAAAALASLGATKTAVDVLVDELTSHQLDLALRSARTLQLLDQTSASASPALRRVLKQATGRENEHPFYLYLRFSLRAALDR